ncbi:MAG: GNAT family N-acetyltransferase [Promethearchaeota archaeon]
MYSLLIRKMIKTDINFAFHLAHDIAGWNNSEEDFLRFLYYNPSGCFIAEEEDRKSRKKTKTNTNTKKIGMITTSVYGEFAWIGNLIVLPSYRGNLVATNLMKHAINYLKNRNAKTIRLDAAIKAVPLYQRLHFKEQYKSLRFVGVFPDNKNTDNSKKKVNRIERMRKKDLQDVISFDQKYTGLSREYVLKKIFNDFPGQNFIFREKNEIIGYIFAKKNNSIITIGPWTCKPDRIMIAQELLENLIRINPNKRIGIGVPEKNKNSVKILINSGFKEIQCSVRMFYGKKTFFEDINGIFGIGSPAKG